MKSVSRQRSLPFLHRNWKTVVNYLQAAAAGTNSEDARSRITNGEDEHYLRPAKRRRFAEGSPDSGIGHEIDGFVLHEDPVETHRSMRIEVLRIMHKDISRARPNDLLNGSIAPTDKDTSTIKARCKITVTTPNRTSGDPRVLYCDSQICTITTFRNPFGTSQMARVYLPQPFQVPEEKIYVERDDDLVFDLADNYAVRVELESAGDHNWPPLNLANPAYSDDIPTPSPLPRHWTLGSEIFNILVPGRRSGFVKLRKGSAPDTPTDFLTEIDVRWAIAMSEKHPDKGQQRISLASIAQPEQQEEPMPLTNGHVNGQRVNGHMTNGHSHPIDDDVEEDADGELTPSRSLRIRGPTKNYNLKVLSAQAQGREPRKRSKNADPKRSGTDRILYYLPREAVPVKEVLVDGYSCCICHASHQSLVQLRAHLVSHSQYKFDVNPGAGKPGSQIDVSCITANSGIQLRPKVYQLGKPTKAFDIEKYVEGDDSWAISRLGPNNDDGTLAAHRRSNHPKAIAARIIQRNSVSRKEKKVLVPATKQPLFDPLSKSKLVPGTEVRLPVADDSWLIQKHRDIVQDFCDVDAAEKEYIKEWDAFIQKRRISSEAFIGRAVLEFVTDKLDWLLESKSRSQEFGKHLTVLIARGLDEETIRLVQSRLQEARIYYQKASGNSTESAPAPEAPKTAPQRNSRGCTVCGRSVRGPSLLICSKDGCKKPLYHDDCIRDAARMSIEHPRWQCNDCL